MSWIANAIHIADVFSSRTVGMVVLTFSGGGLKSWVTIYGAERINNFS
jgi:hypothetical protein